MPNAPAPAENPNTLATLNDVKTILGELEEAKLLDILALSPTVLDIEEASMWLSGDSDVFDGSQPLKQVAGDIVAILTAEEEEEPTRSP